MKDTLAKIATFHRAVGQHVGDVRAPDISRDQQLRLDLIDEEFNKELRPALAAGDVVGVADALADLIYVIAGAAVLWGIPLAEVFDEVHRSNMTKVGGPVRDDGKVLKPAWYEPPDIAAALVRGGMPAMTPPSFAIEQACAAAAKSPCAKSRRGVCAFYGTEVLSLGFNGPPAPLRCDGSAECRADCGKRCVHAEVRAIRPFANLPARATSQIDLVHVKIDEGGTLVTSGGPSCWQCSRELLDVGVRGIWLYQHGGVWRYYDAITFHQVTLTTCEIGGPR